MTVHMILDYCNAVEILLFYPVIFITLFVHPLYCRVMKIIQAFVSDLVMLVVCKPLIMLQHKVKVEYDTLVTPIIM